MIEADFPNVEMKSKASLKFHIGSKIFLSDHDERIEESQKKLTHMPFFGGASEKELFPDDKDGQGHSPFKERLE